MRYSVTAHRIVCIQFFPICVSPEWMNEVQLEIFRCAGKKELYANNSFTSGIFHLSNWCRASEDRAFLIGFATDVWLNQTHWRFTSLVSCCFQQKQLQLRWPFMQRKGLCKFAISNHPTPPSAASEARNSSCPDQTRNPDLNPLDHFFWGYVESMVCAVPPPHCDIPEKSHCSGLRKDSQEQHQGMPVLPWTAGEGDRSWRWSYRVNGD